MIKIKELRIGNKVSVNKGFEMEVVSLFYDVAYLNFEGNEGDVWEEKENDLTSSQTTANVIGCTVDIKEVLLTFSTTGICQVDIEKCVQIWNNSFWNISQWKDEYNLVKVYDSDNYGRCKISKQQAHELIGRLNLIDEKSPIFNSGRTWRQVV